MSAPELPRYRIDRDYEWNYANAPAPVPDHFQPSPGPAAWNYAGLSAHSPIAIAAGPLLNGAWIRYYASLGFDILTYKTVRSRARPSYPPPNLQPVAATSLDPDRDAPLPSARAMRNGGSWAVSFGMPSRDPEIWRRDISETRRALGSHQILSVSVVASPEPGWSVEEIAGDFLRCAKWAAESGADAVEMNFSCPNVSSADGQLYQNPAAAGMMASDVRRELGTVPLLVKIGHITDEALAMCLFQAISPHVNALVMVNCVTARVADEQGNALFGGERRGIAGGLIRAASLEQVQLFREIRAREKSSCELIGGGGISTRGQVQEFLDAGCGAVQIATAAMLNPDPRELFFRG